MNIQTKNINFVKSEASNDQSFFENNNQLLFSQNFHKLIEITEDLLTNQGVYRVMVHFSDNTLVCWSYGNLEDYKVYSAEKVFCPGFKYEFTKSRFLMPLTEQTFPAKFNVRDIPTVINEIKALYKRYSFYSLKDIHINRVTGNYSMAFSNSGKSHIIYSEKSHWMPNAA